MYGVRWDNDPSWLVTECVYNRDIYHLWDWHLIYLSIPLDKALRWFALVEPTTTWRWRNCGCHKMAGFLSCLAFLQQTEKIVWLLKVLVEDTVHEKSTITNETQTET